MINFYNYFNFFYLNKKIFFNILFNIFKFKFFSLKKYFIFLIIFNITKTDIKNFFNFFLNFKVKKVNTLILKRNKNIKKKVFLYFNDTIQI